MTQKQQSTEQKHQTSKPQRTPSSEGPAALQQAHPIQELQGKIGNAQIARMLGEEALWAQPEVGMAGGRVSNQLASRIYQSLGGGHALAHGMQNTLEATFGTPLDHVRIHDDAEADALSLSISSSAFTLGNAPAQTRGSARHPAVLDVHHRATDRRPRQRRSGAPS